MIISIIPQILHVFLQTFCMMLARVSHHPDLLNDLQSGRLSMQAFGSAKNKIAKRDIIHANDLMNIISDSEIPETSKNKDESLYWIKHFNFRLAVINVCPVFVSSELLLSAHLPTSEGWTAEFTVGLWFVISTNGFEPTQRDLTRFDTQHCALTTRPHEHKSQPSKGSQVSLGTSFSSTRCSDGCSATRL